MCKLAPNKTKKYISFKKKILDDDNEKDDKVLLDLRCLDSLRFLAGSLDKLSQPLNI